MHQGATPARELRAPQERTPRDQQPVIRLGRTDAKADVRECGHHPIARSVAAPKSLTRRGQVRAPGPRVPCMRAPMTMPAPPAIMVTVMLVG